MIHGNFNAGEPVEIPNFVQPLPLGRQKLRIIKVVSRDRSKDQTSVNLTYLVGSLQHRGTGFLRLNFKPEYLTPFFVIGVANNNPVIAEKDKTRARIVLQALKKLMLWGGKEAQFVAPGFDDESLVGTEFEGTIVHGYLDDDGRHTKRAGKDGTPEYFLTGDDKKPVQVGPETFDPDQAQAEVRYIAAPPKPKKDAADASDFQESAEAGDEYLPAENEGSTDEEPEMGQSPDDDEQGVGVVL